MRHLRRPPRSMTIGMLVVTACTGPSTDAAPGADTVLRHAFVYTVDSANPRAEAVAITKGRIVYVGPDSGVTPFVGSRTEVLDAGGRMVLPGFIDTHVHPVTGGIELGECNVGPAETLEDVTRIVGACAAKGGADDWVRGGGFPLPAFRNGAPSRTLLDSLVPTRPAFLSSSDGHTGWANTKALELTGITRATKDPVNGRIEREATGGPSGTLRETAQELVRQHMPAYSDDTYVEGLERGLTMAVRFGITSLQEADADEQVLRAFARADSLDRLTVRALINLHVDLDSGPEQQVGRLSALRTRYARGLVRPVGAKIFMDGVIEGQTAALLAPYTDRAGYRGELNTTQARVDALVHALDSADFKVHVHAIGDRAIRTALNAFEQQHDLDGGAGPRHVIAHLQLCDPSDIPRFAALNVVASFQPLWAYRDSYMRDLTEPRLGPVRSTHQYPIASMVRSGARVAAGSDWSVSSMNPLDAIQVAITHRALDDSTGAPWLPNERIDLATALQLDALGGAVAGDDEANTGSLAVGKAADLVVLSDNLFALPAHRIATARVLLTMMGGRVTYRDSTVTLAPAGRGPGGS
ncbi:MAG: amidohydrolase [Gemmatimonadota bacterium]